MKYSKQLLAFSTLFAVGFSMPFGSRQDRAALIRGHKTHAPLITTSVNATSPLSTPPPVKNKSYSKEDNSLEVALGFGGTIIFCLLFQTLRECFKESIRSYELNTHREQLRREREREEGIIQRAQEIAEAIAEARNQLRTEQDQQRRDEQIAIIAQHLRCAILPDGSYALMRLLPPQNSSPGVSRLRIEEDASLLSSVSAVPAVSAVSAFFSSTLDFITSITSLARETPPPQISTPTTNAPLVSSALNEEIPQTQPPTQPQTQFIAPRSSSPGVSRPRIEEDASLLSSVSAFFSSAVDFITSLARETPPQISTPTTNDPLVSSALNEEIPQTQTQPQTQHQLSSQRLANATASLVFAQQQQH